MGYSSPGIVFRALLLALLCFMDASRFCSRWPECGTALTAASDVSVPDCGCEYCTGCLLKLLESSSHCAVCNKKVNEWTRTWRVFPRISSRTPSERGEGVLRTERSRAFPQASLRGLQEFMDNNGTGANEAHVVVAWKGESVNESGNRQTMFVSGDIGNGGEHQRTTLGALAAVLRKALLEPDSQTPQLPVMDFDGFVDRALLDPSDMAHFFRILADPHAELDKVFPAEPGADDRRHALAAYISLEILRVQVEREHRHPLRDWMTRTLRAQGAASNLISLLTKLSVAAKEASSHIAYHEGD